MLSWIKKTPAPSVAPPYSQLAEIYDGLMSHVNYRSWADYVETLLTRFRATPKNVLELACGTGALTMIMACRGYKMSGVDRSEAMIRVAQRKAVENGLSIPFRTGNMVDPPVHETYDAALCLYDSVNYLMDLEELRAMLTRMRGYLEPEGLFIFDICTEINSRRYFNHKVDQDAGETFSYIRRSEYLPEERIQVNEFQILLRVNGRVERYTERHEQRIYPLDVVKKTCLRAGFEILGAFDGFSLAAASERSNRVHFALRPARTVDSIS